MLEEFKKFALRGNVVDLAVGVVIGVAFGAIVASLVADIIMVWVNGVGNHFKGTPYGGYKNSGVGKESCLSELLSYTEEKSIQIFL